MAISISSGQYHPSPRPPLMRRRGPEHDSLLAGFMVAVILAGIVAGMLSAPGGHGTILRDLMLFVAPEQAARSRPAEGVMPLLETMPPAATDTEASPPAPATDAVLVEAGPPTPVLVTGGRAQVVNTDGQGVVLHAAPHSGARRPSGLLEGVTVSVLELRGGEWAHVQTSSRQAGWVPTIYLAPVD